MSSYGVKLTKAYDLYRNSRVGIALFDAIHELLEANLLNSQQALIIRCGRVMADDIAYAKFRKSLLI